MVEINSVKEDIQEDIKRRRKKSGFSFIEFVLCVMLMAIFAAVGWVSYAKITNDSHVAVTQSDLKSFEDTIKSMLMDNPQIAKVPTMYQDAMVYTLLDEYFETEMKIDLKHSGDETTVTTGASTFADYTELQSDTPEGAKTVATYRSDSWKTRYKIFVNCTNLQATGDGLPAGSSTDTEIRIFVICNGKNQMTSPVTCQVEAKDDLILMVEVVNGELSVGYYGFKGIATNNLITWGDSDSITPTEIKKEKDTYFKMQYAYMKPL